MPRPCRSEEIDLRLPIRAVPEMAESRDSYPGANMIQASYWEEASMDGKALFGGFA